jgi:hypothetical protein
MPSICGQLAALDCVPVGYIRELHFLELCITRQGKNKGGADDGEIVVDTRPMETKHAHSFFPQLRASK